MEKKWKLTRGMRNNNPLNLRKGCDWKGLSEHQNDPEFCQFKTIIWGCRAAFSCLRTYIVNRKLNTISLIISKWAPESENNTQAYISQVAKDMNLHPDAVINWYDREVMFALFDAMCRVENGFTIPRYNLVVGYNLV